jgi:MarR family transcriptional regulator for hemolysin
MEKLEEIIFYELEKTIKTYRQFAQSRLQKAGFDITIDQWLILKTIQENTDISQQEIAEKVFKDMASVTRIAEILVQKVYLSREMHPNDRRRFLLTLTSKGEEIIEKVFPIITENRKQALGQLDTAEIENFRKKLITITNNCK